MALLGYSRDNERLADEEALAASLALYGHAGGMAQLFKVLPQADAPAGTAWLRSHPDTAERLARVQAAASPAPAPAPAPAALTPLPPALRELPPER